MAFPPGVTVKDWTWGGSQGYPNPKLGAQPQRFPTIIMIVPPPPPHAAGTLKLARLSSPRRSLVQFPTCRAALAALPTIGSWRSDA